MSGLWRKWVAEYISRKPIHNLETMTAPWFLHCAAGFGGATTLDPDCGCCHRVSGFCSGMQGLYCTLTLRLDLRQRAKHSLIQPRLPITCVLKDARYTRYIFNVVPCFSCFLFQSCCHLTSVFLLFLAIDTSNVISLGSCSLGICMTLVLQQHHRTVTATVASLHCRATPPSLILMHTEPRRKDSSYGNAVLFSAEKNWSGILQQPAVTTTATASPRGGSQ